MTQIIVIVDPGSDSPDLVKIVLSLPYPGTIEEVENKVTKIMKGGIFDALNKVWYPPHQVRRVEYGSS